MNFIGIDLHTNRFACCYRNEHSSAGNPKDKRVEAYGLNDRGPARFFKTLAENTYALSRIHHSPILLSFRAIVVKNFFSVFSISDSLALTAYQSLNHVLNAGVKLRRWYDRLPEYKKAGLVRTGLRRRVFAELYQMLKKGEYHYDADAHNHGISLEFTITTTSTQKRRYIRPPCFADRE
jgi:hypothetical protein